MIVEETYLQKFGDVPRQAVSAFRFPVVLRPERFDRCAHRHDAAEDDTVVGEIHQDPGGGGEQWRRGVQREYGVPPFPRRGGRKPT